MAGSRDEQFKTPSISRNIARFLIFNHIPLSTKATIGIIKRKKILPPIAAAQIGIVIKLDKISANPATAHIVTTSDHNINKPSTILNLFLLLINNFSFSLLLFFRLHFAFSFFDERHILLLDYIIPKNFLKINLQFHQFFDIIFLYRRKLLWKLDVMQSIALTIVRVGFVGRGFFPYWGMEGAVIYTEKMVALTLIFQTLLKRCISIGMYHKRKKN